MKSFIRTLTLFLGVMFVSHVYAADLTAKQIKQVIASVDYAINNLNAKALAKELSTNASITININSQGKKSVMRLTRNEYISMLENGWALYQNYRYNRANTTIIIKNNTAHIQADINESMTINGQHISSSSTEEAVVELIDGKPLITKVIGHLKM